MFFSSGSSSLSLGQKISLQGEIMRAAGLRAKTRAKAIANARSHYEIFIEESVNKILSNFDKFKMSLEESVEDYLSEIQNKFFRTAGRNRANKFQKSITEAKCNTDLILALKESIKEGNEDYDSLKTFLYAGIDSKFCDNNATKFCNPLRVSYTEFLNDILTHAEKQLVPECISNVSHLPAVLLGLINEYHGDQEKQFKKAGIYR